MNSFTRVTGGLRREGRSDRLGDGRAAALEAGEDLRAGPVSGERAREDGDHDHAGRRRRSVQRQRCSSAAFITACRDGNWITTVDFGLPAGWHAEQRPPAFAAAAGHLPPIRGLQTGVVKQIDARPGGRIPRPGRRCRSSQGDTNSVWARLASLYASNAFGAAFYPEVGDEVIVGFMNEDPRFPVVLGSVYSTKLAAGVSARRGEQDQGTEDALEDGADLQRKRQDHHHQDAWRPCHDVMDDKAGLDQHHGQQQELDGLRQGGHHDRQRVEDRDQGEGQHQRSRRTGNLR